MEGVSRLVESSPHKERSLAHRGHAQLCDGVVSDFLIAQHTSTLADVRGTPGAACGQLGSAMPGTFPRNGGGWPELHARVLAGTRLVWEISMAG